MVDDTGEQVEDEAGEKGPEQRPEPRPEPKSDRGPGAAFRTWATVWVVLFCAALGGTIWFLPPSGTWFRRSFGLAWLTPALVIGAAVALIGLFVILTKVKRALDFANPRQGTWVRVGAYVFVGGLALMGAHSFTRLSLTDRWHEPPLWSGEIVGALVKIKPVHLPAAAIFLGALLTTHLVLGGPKISEFLIETQGELVKVSWPPRKEWIGSSTVVLILMGMMAASLWLIDEGLMFVVRRLGIGF